MKVLVYCMRCLRRADLDEMQGMIYNLVHTQRDNPRNIYCLMRQCLWIAQVHWLLGTLMRYADLEKPRYVIFVLEHIERDSPPNMYCLMRQCLRNSQVRLLVGTLMY